MCRRQDNIFAILSAGGGISQGGGGVIPTGATQIVANGDYDIARYARASVQVPGPTGTKQINTNGTHDVTNYAEAVVNIPQPSGAILFHDNGTHDVTDYETAIINVVDKRVKQIVTREANVNLDISGLTSIAPYALSNWVGLKSLNWPNIVTIGDHALDGTQGLTLTSWPEGLTSIGEYALFGAHITMDATPVITTYGTGCLSGVVVDGGSLLVRGPETLPSFYLANIVCDTVTFSSACKSISYRCLGNANTTTVRFMGNVYYINATAFESDTITDIYVPWSEGAVSGAPWGATNATIHYDSAV